MARVRKAFNFCKRTKVYAPDIQQPAKPQKPGTESFGESPESPEIAEKHNPETPEISGVNY